MQSSHLSDFTISQVEFAFTNLKTAHKQLAIIKDRIQNGGWWWDSAGKPLTGKILSDYSGKKSAGYGILRDVLIETPSGLREVFRLVEREINSGFDLNF